MALTTETIHAAADKIAQTGKRPTLTAVRAALGGGSFSTISEAMQSWREAQEAEHALAHVDLPDQVRERMETATAALWEAATNEAERKLAAERDALAEARDAADAEITEAREAVETLEREAEAAAAEIEALKVALAEAKAAAQQAEAAAAEKAARLESAQQQISAADQRAEAAQTRAEAALIEAAELRGQLTALKAPASRAKK